MRYTFNLGRFKFEREEESTILSIYMNGSCLCVVPQDEWFYFLRNLRLGHGAHWTQSFTYNYDKIRLLYFNKMLVVISADTSQIYAECSEVSDFELQVAIMTLARLCYDTMPEASNDIVYMLDILRESYTLFVDICTLQKED